MPSALLEAVQPVPLKKPPPVKVDLIAWDPESPAHVERMVQQRLACGWKADYVEQWRDLQRAGKMALQWVVLSCTDADEAAKLSQHLAQHPAERTPLHDTATALGGQPRAATAAPFTPIGHISLDAESANAGQADAAQGIYCITTFYISRAVQGGGLGRAAMDAVEAAAVAAPLRARVLSLDTLANASRNVDAMFAALGGQPAISNQDWYERRGYRVWRTVEGHIRHTDRTGRVWPLDAVFMKKTVA